MTAQTDSNSFEYGDYEDLTNALENYRVEEPGGNHAHVELTPIHRAVHKGEVYYLKRDDLYWIQGVNGGKARVAWRLAQGAKGLVTAGSRESPQINIVASIAKGMGIPAICYAPWGKTLPQVQLAIDKGADVRRVKPGYNTQLLYGVKQTMKEKEGEGWIAIPFGMETELAVIHTAAQVYPIWGMPERPKRIVVPLGSAMTFCGILDGLDKSRIWDIPILGVWQGAQPWKRIKKYAPTDWDRRFDVTFQKSALGYHTPYPKPVFAGVKLDEIYEAKCIPYLKPGDLMWIVATREAYKSDPYTLKEIPSEARLLIEPLAEDGHLKQADPTPAWKEDPDWWEISKEE